MQSSLNADKLRMISENEKDKIRCESQGLHRKLSSTEVALMTSVCGFILQ